MTSSLPQRLGAPLFPDFLESVPQYPGPGRGTRVGRLSPAWRSPAPSAARREPKGLQRASSTRWPRVCFVAW